MTSERLYDALDLCLECKGCRAECESGVDMAKLKYEFLDNYYKTNGLPRRNRIFGNIAKYSKLGSRFAPLSNWMASSPLGKLVSSSLLGIHPNRRAPKFARQTFPQWFRGPRNRHTYQGTAEAALSESTARTTVVLLNDTYMNYNYPEIGKAAVALLEAAGFKVELADAPCCGRPMISKGMMDEAVANARHNVGLLHAYAGNGVPIIGCEPSCLLTLRDEYPQLVPGEQSRTVASSGVPDRRVPGEAEGRGQAGHRVQGHGQAGAVPRPLPPALAGRHRVVAERAAAGPRLPRGADQRRLLRHGRLLRLREGALRHLHDHWRAVPVPGRSTPRAPTGRWR